MSNKNRYYDIVLDAISELTPHKVGFEHQWIAVGEVAKKAQVSKPTARKYLNIMWEQGIVLAAVFDGSAGYRCKVLGR